MMVKLVRSMIVNAVKVVKSNQTEELSKVLSFVNENEEKYKNASRLLSTLSFFLFFLFLISNENFIKRSPSIQIVYKGQ
jgi:cytoskeletal protein RodZ